MCTVVIFSVFGFRFIHQNGKEREREKQTTRNSIEQCNQAVTNFEKIDQRSEKAFFIIPNTPGARDYEQNYDIFLKKEFSQIFHDIDDVMSDKDWNAIILWNQ